MSKSGQDLLAEYESSHPGSRKLYEEARAFTTEGVQHAIRHLSPYPAYMCRGEGPRIFDVDGNAYIDYVLGFGPLLLGHRHPRVVEAVARQMAETQLLGAPSEHEVEMARKICQHVPSAKSVRLLPSGNDANALAVVLARAWTGRDLMIKIEGAFHGSHDYFLPGLHLEVDDGRVPGIPKAMSDSTLVIPFNDEESLTRVFAENGEKLACVMTEPILRGIVLPAPGYLEKLRSLCDEYGVILIYDEVVSGVRLGLGGYQAIHGVLPDLTALGKALGAGFPIGALAGRQDLLNLLSPLYKGKNWIFSASTWYGWPIANVAGLAAIEVLEQEGAYERLYGLGEHFRSSFNKMFAEVGVKMQAIGVGPINKLIFTDEKLNDWQSSRPKYPMEAAQELKMRLFTLGLHVVGPGAYIVGFGKYISLVHTNEVIDESVSIFRQALQDTGFAEKELANG